MESYPSVCFVILNWNSWKDTVECLESIQRLEYSNYTIVLVDNESSDDSLLQINAWVNGNLPVQSKYLRFDPGKKPVQLVEYTRVVAEAGGKVEEEKLLGMLPSDRKLVLIQSGANLGFAEGCNVGIRYALKTGCEVVCLLNNDTVPEPDALNKLVDHFVQPKVGIVGGKILYYHEPDYIWYGGGHVSLIGKGPGYVFEGINQKDSPVWNQKRKVSFVTGCVMAIHRRVLESIGLIDGRFFFGAEDADFCLRTTQAGFDIVYEPSAVIYHRVARTYDKFSAKHVYYVYRGKFIFMRKHLPAILWWLWVVAFMVYALTFATVKRALARRSLKDGFQMSKAAIAAFKDTVQSFNDYKTLIQ
jgi:GT2 family glycosyltransferase